MLDPRLINLLDALRRSCPPHRLALPLPVRAIALAPFVLCAALVFASPGLAADPVPDPSLRTFVFKAMTTEAHVVLPTSPSTSAAASGAASLPSPEEFFDLAREAVLEVERLMSPRGEDSDVARFNRSAAGEWVPVSPLTLAVLEECARGYAYSGGGFDPTVGALKGLFSFQGGELDSWPDDAQIQKARQSLGFGEIRTDPAASAIFKPKDGVLLDLGAAAKGYAVDRALAALKAAGAENALVEIGGEVGTLGITPKGEPWRVRVEDPRAQGQRLTFELSNSATATSGGRVNYFTYQGKRYTHLIDPRTGTPIPEGTLQTTVAHPDSCLAADVMSTALFVVGPDGAKGALEAYARDALSRKSPIEGLEALVFYRDGDGGVRIRIFTVARDGKVTESEGVAEALAAAPSAP
ncbi:MAG: FAD:protein FMN transferase [Deltaproteobacteria bacterium]|jgi:thiamine biosynthesis lipoprotein|nr:FAD:protein FMN transferase [Deltaproteobacteria bacterium]